jgi:transcriptional regulator with XRE-family HTH domain
MRNSPLKHPVAVLRTMLGLSQEEFGKEINLSRRTIQSIELGNLRLTEENALLIQQRIGVSIHWLLGGDPAVEPYFEDERERRVRYTREMYDELRAAKASGLGIVRPDTTPSRLHMGALATVHDWFPILSAARKAGKGDLAVFYLHKFLGEMRQQFGYDGAAADEISKKSKLIEADGSAWLFDYSDEPGVFTRVKRKSGVKTRAGAKGGSPKKP